jgi:predicted site-specific integrase-resolvase
MLARCAAVRSGRGGASRSVRTFWLRVFRGGVSLAASGRRLIVVDPGEMNDDLAPDMIAILTSFCARLYGRRGARNRARSIECALATAEAAS